MTPIVPLIKGIWILKENDFHQDKWKRQMKSSACLDMQPASFLYSANLIFKPKTTDCCANVQLVILLCGK